MNSLLLCYFCFTEFRNVSINLFNLTAGAIQQTIVNCIYGWWQYYIYNFNKTGNHETSWKLSQKLHWAYRPTVAFAAFNNIAGAERMTAEQMDTTNVMFRFVFQWEKNKYFSFPNLISSSAWLGWVNSSLLISCGCGCMVHWSFQAHPQIHIW